MFTDFAAHLGDLFGRHTVNLGHRFDAADGLFGDAALVSLIERTPAHAYHVNTMDVTTHAPNTRREGTMEGLSGADALDAVRNGHIWILLQQPHRLDSHYAEVLRSIYAELALRVEGFKSFNHKMSITPMSRDRRSGSAQRLRGQLCQRSFAPSARARALAPDGKQPWALCAAGSGGRA